MDANEIEAARAAKEQLRNSLSQLAALIPAGKQIQHTLRPVVECCLGDQFVEINAVGVASQEIIDAVARFTVAVTRAIDRGESQIAELDELMKG